MLEIAPGSILQRMYFKNRLRSALASARSFIEVGSGGGYISNILLKFGFSGKAFDLNPESNKKNEAFNQEFLKDGKYKVITGDFLQSEQDEPVDVICSSMVIEHLTPEQVDTYFEKAKSLLSDTGKIITFVPAGNRYWGIEDEIAGHMKRYEFSCFEEIAKKHQLKVSHLVGLTYPLSNLLLGLSNFLVKKSEEGKLSLSMQERTEESGNREVAFKTSYPTWMSYILNEWTMYPWYLLQSLFLKSDRNMVLYCELERA